MSFYTHVIGQNLHLKISSKDSLETRVIDSINYIKVHKDYLAITNEIDSLKNKLNRLGYISNKSKPTSKLNDSTYHETISLNEKYTSLKIYYDSTFVAKQIIQHVTDDFNKSSFIIPFSRIEATLKYINLKISEQGFPFNELKLSNIHIKESSFLESELIISNTNKKRYADKILVKGYEKFPRSFLKHYLKLKPEELINITDIQNKTALLEELPFANQIKEPEILFTKDSTILYVYIEKKRSNTFDGFLGFGTNEETNNLEFNGYLNLDLINNLNFGESFSLIYKSDENEQKTFNVKLFIPYLFNTPLGTELELAIFKRDSSFTTVNQNARFYYQLNPKNRVSLGIKSIQSNNLLNALNTDPTIKDYSTTFYNVRYEFIKRQSSSRLFRKNALLDIEAGFGKRQTEGVSNNQSNVLINAFKIFNLNSKNSIFLRTNGFSLFSETYLENELARFGGINSIRGFEENSLSASFYALLNTEYRYLLNNSIFIHSIIDLAYFENRLIKQKEKLYGFGFGFGVLTKAGLLRFNYANGKNENQNFNLSNSQIHLSLSAVF